MSKHTKGPVFISTEQVQQLNEKHGWFEFGDAQSDVSNAFANEAIERYERIRAAAPELLELLKKWQKFSQEGCSGNEWEALLIERNAAIAKAEGEQQ